VTFKRYVLTQRVVNDLKKRSSIGIIFYIILAVIIILDQGYYSRNKDFALTFMVSLNSICLFRVIHLIFFNKIEKYNEKLNNTIFIFSVITTSLIWGASFAYFVIQENESSSKLLMVMCTAGLCSGGIVAFLPERRLAIVFNICMTCPAILYCVIYGINYPLAVMIFLFSIYMVSMTYRGNREYWDALENETRLKEQAVELQRLSHTDALTGLYNRRYFNDIFEFEWKRSYRNNILITIIICDIDYFKHINDTFGHIAGDEYLKRTAEILKDVFKRDTDIVARYGGEEFVIVISGGDPQGIAKMTDNVRKKVEENGVRFKGEEMKATLSFGIASCIASSQESLNSLITKADQALYRAKKNGRNRVETTID